MASYPPPPPPPPPPGYDPQAQRRYQRDQFRAQMRAQRDAFRAQRQQIRYQMRGMRRGSVLGPLLLIAIGVLFLLIETSRLITAASGSGTDIGGRCCWLRPALFCWPSGPSTSSICAIPSGRPTAAPPASASFCCCSSWCSPASSDITSHPEAIAIVATASTRTILTSSSATSTRATRRWTSPSRPAAPLRWSIRAAM